MNSTGKIIVCAYPDTFVRISDEFVCRVLPYLGLGTKKFIKAGHAALVLIENETGKCFYYDFGRYITPAGKGRVRSAQTDVELALPMKASFNKSGELGNLDEFLIWLSSNPQQTHGEGRLVAGLCNEVDFGKARSYILKLQEEGSVPYRAFGKDGSNCSRFVTETLIKSTLSSKIKRALRINKNFSPSPLGNVEIATNGTIFQVTRGNIQKYRLSAFRENLVNFFDRPKTELALEKGKAVLPENATFLDGTGSQAWFALTSSQKKGKYLISRYNSLGVKDFEGIFRLIENSLDLNKPFRFVYDSNCLFCTLEQGGRRLQLQRIGEPLF